MKTTFEKQEFNTEFDHTSNVVKMFNEMGYSNIKVETCFTNGLSIYVTLTVEVLNEGKCWMNMFVSNKRATIKVRISDHISGLEKNCNGVSGNTMTMNMFRKLINTGAIKNNN